MTLRGKQVLVTGAGGFIGSHLSEKLVEIGASVRALVHYNSAGSWGWLDDSPLKDEMEIVAGDVTDRDSVRRAMQGVDIVFHLAALIAIPYSYQAPTSYLRTNAEGTLNVLQAALEAEVERVLHTSTSEVYGTAQYVPIDEHHPLQGQSPYSATKIAADQLAEAFHRSYGLPVTIVRPFNTFGPRQSARAVIPTIIVQALSCDRIKLGHLAPTRDFNFVRDTVAGFLSLAQSPGVIGEVVNIGSGREISIGDLAHHILKVLGKDLPIEEDAARVRPEKSEVDRLLADNSKASELTGWKPQYSLEEGLQVTAEWIAQHLDRYRSDVYTI